MGVHFESEIKLSAKKNIVVRPHKTRVSNLNYAHVPTVYSQAIFDLLH